MSEVNNFSEAVGIGCYTSPKWNRDVCQATRVDFAGFRFYKHGTPEDPLYRKGATFLSDRVTGLTGEDKHLKSWRRDMEAKLGSADKFDTFMKSMADFGTEGHILYDLLIQGTASVESVTLAITNFAQEAGLSQVGQWKALETAKKNLLAFRQFNIEHEIEVFAVEQMVTSAKLGTSTPVDILATGMFSRTKGARKERCWLLGNLKTSENAQNHGWQCAVEYLAAYESIVAQMLSIENLPVVVGTIRPKDWKDTPTFEFKNYTDFAQLENTQKTLFATAEMLISNGQMTPPNISEIVWEGPLTAETEFTYNPLF